MTTRTDFDRALTTWLADERPSTAPAGLIDAVLDQVAETDRRAGWLVPDRWTWTAAAVRFGSLARIAAIAAVVALLIVAGAIAVGSGLVRQPALPPPDPSPSPLAQASPSTPPSLAPSLSPRPQVGLVAYSVSEPLEVGEGDCREGSLIHCSVNRIWVVNADGTGAHQLLPDVPGDQVVMGWSPDGLRLLYRDGLGNLALTDAAGSEPEVLTWDSLCPEEVRDDNCGARSDEGGVAFSPDSTRLAYTIAEGRDADVSTIAVLDLSTRQVTRVESTRSNALIPCTTAASAGDNARPTWSPDGSQLVFERQAIGPVRNGGCQAAVFVVNADGSDLRQLVSAEMVAIHPSWSADGTRIVFQSSTFLPGYPQDDTALTSDVYSVRPDVSDLRRLSIDGLSIAPRWTRDGRIVFRHRDTGGLSIMNADGDVATQIRDDSIPDLTAVACVTCPYALAAGDGEAFWQPAP